MYESSDVMQNGISCIRYRAGANGQATAIHNDPEPPELNYWSALKFHISSHDS